MQNFTFTLLDFSWDDSDMFGSSFTLLSKIKAFNSSTMFSTNTLRLLSVSLLNFSMNTLRMPTNRALWHITGNMQRINIGGSQQMIEQVMSA